MGLALLGFVPAIGRAQSPVVSRRSHIEEARIAMMLAGRAHPSDAEVDRGAAAMDRGATRTQIQAIARSSDPDRSLVVAFETVAALADKGMPVKQAVLRVQANITSGASDPALAALVTVDGVSVANSAHVRP